MRTSWASLRNAASIAGSNSASVTAMWSLTLLPSSVSTDVCMGPLTLPVGPLPSGMDVGTVTPSRTRGEDGHGDQGQPVGVRPVHRPVDRGGGLAVLAGPRDLPRAVAGDRRRDRRVARRRDRHGGDR